MGIQRHPGGFVLVAVNVVDQHAYPNTPVGGFDDFVSEQTSDRVLMVHVVLNIETLLRQTCQQRAGREGVAAMTQQEYTGFAGMVGQRSTKLFPQRGGFAIVDHVGLFTAGYIGQTIENAHC